LPADGFGFLRPAVNSLSQKTTGLPKLFDKAVPYRDNQNLGDYELKKR
jgi:hypothetical protein